MSLWINTLAILATVVYLVGRWALLTGVSAPQQNTENNQMVQYNRRFNVEGGERGLRLGRVTKNPYMQFAL